MERLNSRLTSSEIGIMSEMRRTKRIGKTITYLVRSGSTARVGIGLGLGLGLGG